MGITATATRRSGYAHDVEIEGGHRLVMDEPLDDGGTDLGPSPTRVLAAALASCTAITVEMYADRKGWELGDLAVDVEMEYDSDTRTRSFVVTMRLPGGLSEEQLEKLRVIAGRCPVHRALSDETRVSVEDRIAPL